MKNEEISKFIHSRIAVGDFPSAVYLVAEKGEIVFTDALGFAVVEPERIAANLDTIYDLASLTKVLVTGLLCAKLIESGEIDLERFIDFYLPEFKSTPDFKDDILIKELLVHRTYFAAWKPLYLSVQSRSDVLTEIIKMPFNWDQQVITYSDLNFITLTFLLEKVCGGRLDEIAKREIFEPLNLHDTFYNPPKTLQKRVAASEKGNEFEKQMCIEKGYEISNHQSAFRTQAIWGEVHDGNCYFMNGVSGHAGFVFKCFRDFQYRAAIPGESNDFVTAGNVQIISHEFYRRIK